MQIEVSQIQNPPQTVTEMDLNHSGSIGIDRMLNEKIRPKILIMDNNDRVKQAE